MNEKLVAALRSRIDIKRIEMSILDPAYQEERLALQTADRYVGSLERYLKATEENIILLLPEEYDKLIEVLSRLKSGELNLHTRQDQFGLGMSVGWGYVPTDIFVGEEFAQAGARWSTAHVGRGNLAELVRRCPRECCVLSGFEFNFATPVMVNGVMMSFPPPPLARCPRCLTTDVRYELFKGMVCNRCNHWC